MTITGIRAIICFTNFVTMLSVKRTKRQKLDKEGRGCTDRSGIHLEIGGEIRISIKKVSK